MGLVAGRARQGDHRAFQADPIKSIGRQRNEEGTQE
jgi:hypothetical protein